VVDEDAGPLLVEAEGAQPTERVPALHGWSVNGGSGSVRM
jgi:hypothetical protein